VDPARLGGTRPVRADHRHDDQRRRIDELAAYLFREDDFPFGVVLSTGTSLVPDLPFTLEAGDEIRISISEIGELVNQVVRGKAAVAVHAGGLGQAPLG